MAEERQTQCTGMLSREQLLCLFERFDSLISQPDVKKRIADAVNDQQEAVAVTTAIQEELGTSSLAQLQLWKANWPLDGEIVVLLASDWPVANKLGTSSLAELQLWKANWPLDGEIMILFASDWPAANKVTSGAFLITSWQTTFSESRSSFDSPFPYLRDPREYQKQYQFQKDPAPLGQQALLAAPALTDVITPIKLLQSITCLNDQNSTDRADHHVRANLCRNRIQRNVMVCLTG
ncbi:hypothetical protein Cgig2_003079 [Carnegiea gigantea]|uniref:Uncharacterized protein n=1 Tax=Carnegiea gigantea TaxID=171969 RepID=A0A9Q1KEV8_9CARY|nr:hypothetical protein Cgig2_003079 [Carnegiea gigantea]